MKLLYLLMVINGADCDKGDNSYRTRIKITSMCLYKGNNEIYCCRKKSC
jgi:hypothetical protein